MTTLSQEQNARTMRHLDERTAPLPYQQKHDFEIRHLTKNVFLIAFSFDVPDYLFDYICDYFSSAKRDARNSVLVSITISQKLGTDLIALQRDTDNIIDYHHKFQEFKKAEKETQTLADKMRNTALYRRYKMAKDKREQAQAILYRYKIAWEHYTCSRDSFRGCSLLFFAMTIFDHVYRMLGHTDQTADLQQVKRAYWRQLKQKKQGRGNPTHRAYHIVEYLKINGFADKKSAS